MALARRPPARRPAAIDLRSWLAMRLTSSHRLAGRLRGTALVALAALACGAIAILNARRAEAKSASLPHAVKLARADAAKRKHVTVGEVRVVKVTARTWPDGCLGLGRRDEMCAQLVTRGYRATFSVRGKRVVYRTDHGSSYRRESG
jgi:hypothetical protein